jgi:hypothetical protein
MAGASGRIGRILRGRSRVNSGDKLLHDAILGVLIEQRVGGLVEHVYRERIVAAIMSKLRELEKRGDEDVK